MGPIASQYCPLTSIANNDEQGSDGLTCVEQILVQPLVSYKLTTIGGLGSKYAWGAELVLIFVL